MIGDTNIATDPIAAKAALGYLPESARATGDDVRDYLAFIADVRGLKDVAKAVAAVIGKGEARDGRRTDD